MRTVLIAAIGRNGELGKDGRLPWHLPEDLRHFKQVTSGQVVVMGRKTYESLPRRLDNRTVIVVTTQKDYRADDAIVFNSVGEVMEYAHKQDLETLYIAGGGEMYKHFLPLADALLLTRVDQEYNADTFLDIDYSDWELRSSFVRKQGDLQYAFQYCERKK
jgi:dihydrofolate reductase